MKKLFIAALFASAIAAPASAAELVSNGGFEDGGGLFGWTFTDSDTLSILINPSAVHSGANAAYFIAPAGYASDFLAQTLDTVVGQIYDYSFWVAAATTDENAPSAFYAQLGSQVLADFTYSPTFNFMQFSGTFVATDTATDIYFEAFNSLGLFELDDVSVTSRPAPCATRVCTVDGGVPEPASWALMLLGFGGIGAILRRRPRLQTA